MLKPECDGKCSQSCERAPPPCALPPAASPPITGLCAPPQRLYQSLSPGSLSAALGVGMQRQVPTSVTASQPHSLVTGASADHQQPSITASAADHQS
uniref:Uncharacterized protein n=1 Tax=Knipowitschia caucasica TaxID=637954 RepID=A0AAV2LKL7_KNICA